VGAGQAIDQLKLYGDAVKWFFELGVHDATPDRLRWIRALACRAYWTALDNRPGPVHLNVPLREPLVLGDQPLPPDPTGRSDGRPRVLRAPAEPSPPGTLPELPPRGVIVAGRIEQDRTLHAAAAEFAERVGYPLLADALSGARHGPAAIAHYDLLLRDERFAAAMAPQLVIRIGDLPTSKALRAWLQGLENADQVALDPLATWQDPAAALSALDLSDPARALETWGPETPANPDWLARWRGADDAADQAIALTLDDELSEPAVARSLGEWFPAEVTLFVASSMPVRDVELFLGARELGSRVLANRGANGIDGTVSSAVGAAAASDGPVVLLIGDVALAHDVGGLLAARRLGLALTIVVLNNDGGGIFHFLPVAGESDGFEEHIATPHGLDFAHAAALYGCEYVRAESLQELRGCLDGALAAPATTIVEVRTDREENLALHRRVADAVAAAIPAA
jgi:2-succinyl-5-enolpyruvyl-6-hydroxy-3-cyclohexene-1-carboxylate synthase